MIKSIGYIIFLFCFISFYGLKAQDWKWLNPLPAYANYKSVSFPTSKVGYAVGTSGTIVKTTDGGDNWFLLNSGTCEELYSVCFTDENTGYVSGYDIILQTKDGGKTWDAETFGIDDQISSITFPTKEIGYAISFGWGFVIKTTDSGKNWKNLGYLFEKAFASYFINKDTGFVVSRDGIMLKTENGGHKWKYIINPATGPNQVDFSSIYFPDKKTGYALAYATDTASSILIKSTDGGNTWKIKNYFSDDSLIYNDRLYFKDSLNGYIYGSKGISKTQDGGKTWIVFSKLHGSYSEGCFLNKDTLFLLIGGGIFKTTDEGKSWKNGIRKIISEGVNTMFFIDSLRGYIGTGNDSGAVIYFTKDGCRSFVKQELPKNNIITISHISFVDSLHGYAAAGYGVKKIIKTNDGGETWFFPDTIYNHNYIESMQFISQDTGYVIESFGKMLKTTDGAKTWNIIINDNYLTWGSGWTSYGKMMQFINSKIGYIVGVDENLRKGMVLKTLDGGFSWEKYIFSYYFHSVFFINKDTGFASVAENYDYVYLIKTTNGGKDWITVYSEYDKGFNNINFLNDTIGYMLVQSYYGRSIYSTRDGGISWNSTCPLQIDHLSFPSDKIGYAAGGGILKTTNGGGIYTNIINLEKQNDTYSNYQIFPNPVNENSILSYKLPDKSNIQIKIYDYTGREVKTLLNAKQEKGDYQIKLNSNNLKNGIYFVRIFNGKNSKTLKFLVSEY